MRLLHSGSGEMKEFVSYASVPPYAILSHTWGDEEVSFQDWEREPWPEIQKRKGFRKIEYCCQQAARDRIEWVWVDTCCIDKRSSAELTESINSMFRWYRDAVVCYAYLIDVHASASAIRTVIESELAASRWFARGWTLQELLAPATVIFFSSSWQRVGTKSQLSSSVAAITGIEEPYLLSGDVGRASVAQRMSWAARRETSRDEDVAYCLLGIFDVNMPLIYGEGRRAFQRLQEEIMRAYPEDHTLFAWGTVVDSFSRFVRGAPQILGDEPVEWKPPPSRDDYDDDEVDENEDDEDGSGLLGFLARSPRDFAESGKFVSYREAKKFFRRWDSPLTAPAIVGRTTRLDIPVVSELGAPFAVCHVRPIPAAQLRSAKVAILVCGRQEAVPRSEKGGDAESEFRFATIPLLTCTGGYHARTRELVVSKRIACPGLDYDGLYRLRQHLVIERQPAYRPQAGDIVLRRFVPLVPCGTCLSADTIDVAIDDGFIRALAPTHGRVACLTFASGETSGLALNISRVGYAGKTGGAGNLHFALLPVDLAAQAEDAWTASEQSWDYHTVAEESEESAEDGKGREEAMSDEDEEEEEKKEGEVGVETRAKSGRELKMIKKLVEDLEKTTIAERAEGAYHEPPPVPTAVPRPIAPPPLFQSVTVGYHWLWNMDHWREVQHMQVMNIPKDTWEVPESRVNPRIRITTERMYIDDDPDQPVDVVDMIMTTRAPWQGGGG
ncbi:heterokaryon incompatibility protein-domain-containing protein [Hypoxylon sp. NC1633]|nr:heterokaryon incompatibility protein-domain-containing protein [Hypoxylon sp. NC1633]